MSIPVSKAAGMARRRSERERARSRSQESGPSQVVASPLLSQMQPWIYPALVLIAVTVAAFVRVLGHDFTNWDDTINITENPLVKPPSIEGLLMLWTEPYHGLYIPLVYTSYLFDFLAGGGNAWFFHLTNLVLHVGAALTVMVILARLASLSAAGDGASALVRFGATAGAVLFAVHPLQAEPVSWLTGRKDVLSGLFALIAVQQYIEVLCAGGRAPGGVFGSRHYWVASVAFILSLLCKPGAVSLPLALFAVEFFVWRRPVRGSLTALAPWLAVAALWTVLTMGAHGVPPQLKASMPLWTRPFIAADALLFYVRKLFVPVGLAPVYGRVPAEILKHGWIYATLPVAGILFVGLLWLRGAWAASAAFFVACLLPTLRLTPFLYQNYSTVADRYAYVSMLGAAMALSHGIILVGTRRPGLLIPVRAIVVMVVLVFAVLASRQAGFWKTSETLWRRSIAVAPDVAESRNNLGQALVKQNRRAEALAEFEAAVRLKPDFGEAYNNIGLELMKQGKLPDAVAQFERGIEELINLGFTDERLFETRNNLAVAYLRMSRYADAEQTLRKALEWQAAQPRALNTVYVNLGTALQKQGRLTDAAAMLQQALDIKPDDPQVQNQLQQLQKQMGSQQPGR
jgi:protein O-mannosyl-transferase